MPTAIPSIDNNACAAWTENDVNLYNSYDFFLAKMQVERRQQNMVFSKLLKKKPWKPNHGPVLRGVRTNPSPNLRQHAYPKAVRSGGMPLVDTVNVTETTSDAVVYWQDFDTPAMSFLPDFQDFMGHVDDNAQDIMKRVEIFEEVFYRTMMFYGAPFFFIAKGDSMTLINTTPFDFTQQLVAANTTKSAAALTGYVNAHPDMTHITMKGLSHALTQMSVNLGVPPFSGTGLQSGDDKALDQKYLLITGEETWTQFSFDPYLQQHKNCDLDVVNGQFQGSLFGRLTTRLETHPLFMTAAGAFEEPESRVGNATALNNGETIPNPDYVDLDTSPYAWSFLSGNIGYTGLQVGPPPAAFTKDTPPHNFPAMSWNGEVYLTKNFLLECPDPVTGAVRYLTNEKGRWIKAAASLALGIYPNQRRNVIPILHKRKQVV